ncbi:MAG: type II secretory pathway component PulF [Pseudohongiellaceae bacterium]|jgi:type II secretory pathway component PulF
MKSLTKIEKIQLIKQLVALINAGIPPSSAVANIRESDERVAVFLSITAKRLRMGESFSVSFAESSLLNRFDIILLEIAEESGQLSLGLVDIQNRLEQRHNQVKILKQKCYLPLGTLAVAVLATTFLTLARDTPMQAFFQLLTGSGYFFILGLFVKSVLAHSNNATDFAFRIFWRQPKLRSVGLLQNIIEYNWYYNLIFQLRAGINAFQAVKALERLCNEPGYLASVGNCQKLISSGSDLSSALTNSGLVFNTNLYTLLNTAEKSGSLDSAITRYLTQQKSDLENQIGSLNQWFSRAFYFLVLLIAISLF